MQFLFFFFWFSIAKPTRWHFYHPNSLIKCRCQSTVANERPTPTIQMNRCSVFQRDGTHSQSTLATHQSPNSTNCTFWVSRTEPYNCIVNRFHWNPQLVRRSLLLLPRSVARTQEASYWRCSVPRCECGRFVVQSRVFVTPCWTGRDGDVSNVLIQVFNIRSIRCAWIRNGFHFR